MTNASPMDRSAEDTGNIVLLEHVNICVPDQLLATSFYMSALGLTRDPFMMTGTDVMWVNVGRNQFHLPSRGTQVLRGTVGLVVPWFDELEDRLARARPLLEGTAYGFEVRNDRIDVTCPWGNRIRCHPPGQTYGDTVLGMPYVTFDVPVGTAPVIARFYNEILDAPASEVERDGAAATAVQAGPAQTLFFRESEDTPAPFDGHHIQIYISDFSGPYEKLREHDAVSAEDGPHQYRFVDIVDPDTSARVFKIEHEVRSLNHPLFARPLINRDPRQNIMNYKRGADAFTVG